MELVLAQNVTNHYTAAALHLILRRCLHDPETVQEMSNLSFTLDLQRLYLFPLSFWSAGKSY